MLFWKSFLSLVLIKPSVEISQYRKSWDTMVIVSIKNLFPAKFEGLGTTTLQCILWRSVNSKKKKDTWVLWLALWARSHSLISTILNAIGIWMQRLRAKQRLQDYVDFWKFYRVMLGIEGNIFPGLICSFIRSHCSKTQSTPWINEKCGTDMGKLWDLTHVPCCHGAILVKAVWKLDVVPLSPPLHTETSPRTTPLWCQFSF